MLSRTKWTHTPNPALADPTAPLLVATFNPPAPGSTSSRRSALSSVLRTEFSPGSRLTRLWVVVIRIQLGSAPPLPRFILLSEPAAQSLKSWHQSLRPLRKRAPPTPPFSSFEWYFCSLLPSGIFAPRSPRRAVNSRTRLSGNHVGWVYLIRSLSRALAVI